MQQFGQKKLDTKAGKHWKPNDREVKLRKASRKLEGLKSIMKFEIF